MLQAKSCTPLLVAIATSLADDAPRPSRDLGDLVAAEVLNDLIERARHGVERRELLDEAIAALDGLTALNGLAVAEHRA
jgi:hypothetical protein